MSRLDLEALFLANLDKIDRIIGALGRRHGLSSDDADDFGAWVKMRIVENDYAILSKFRGESSLPTYLTVVIAMLFREFRVHEWGRWRPSAIARRIGPIGVRLETLIHRDGMALSAAFQLVRTSGETTLSDNELAAIVAQLPRRTPLRPVVYGDQPADVAGPDQADKELNAKETDARRSEVKRILANALAQLPEDDRVVVRLHYMNDMSVADIARGLALPQKPLYRRLERALAALRRLLERAGVSLEAIRELGAEPP